MTVDPGILAADLRDLWKTSLAMYDLDAPRLLSAATLVELVVVPLYAVWSETKPPCPTCDGTREVPGDHRNFTVFPMRGPCPDCPDHPGVQPFNNWVAGLAATSLQERTT